MPPVVQAIDVSYAYPRRADSLSRLSLDVDSGDTVHIAGPSGSGKSTFARCLSGLIPHLYRGNLSGTISLDGLRTDTTPLWQLSERAGLVFQNPATQMLTVTVEQEIIFGLENLGLPTAAINERLEEALSRFGLAAFRGRSPHTLSGGEQQKLALAAVTARHPAVLVLDEPLSMLDSTASSDLVDHLADLAARGTAVIICEHRRDYLCGIPRLRTLQLDGSAVRPPTPLPLPESAARHLPPFCLEVSGLHVDLGGRPVLRNLNFSVDGGQVLAIVGRNGVGKTTLLRALAGLQPYRGDIAIDGAQPQLGLVFHNPDLQLFNATVRDEVLYRLPDPDMERYEWLLGLLGLRAYQDTPPLLLSEGEKKRVALATILMRGPPHGILLDEPALGQDSAHRRVLTVLGRALAASGHLVILTTHDLGLAAEADQLMILGEDGLVAQAQPADLLSDPVPWEKIGLVVPDWVLDA